MRRKIRSLGMAAVLAVAISFAPGMTGLAHAALPICNEVYPYYPTVHTDVLAALPTYSTPTGPRTTSCVLRRQTSPTYNWGVQILQRTMNECFHLSELLVEDGKFGGRTQAMLREAQALVGTAADGEYGPNTRTAFNYHWRWYANLYGDKYCTQVYYPN